jgi:hypothetical protein
MLLVGFVWAAEDESQPGEMGQQPAAQQELERSIEQEQQQVEQMLGEGKPSEQRNGSGQQEPQAQQQEPQQQVEGQILKEKEVQIKGKDQNNRVILIEAKDGRRIAIDLGPTQNLADVQIQVGQNASVKGRLVRIGDRKVLFAGELTVNGKTVQIRRMMEQSQIRQRNAGQKDAGTSEEESMCQPQQISGQIVKERDVSVKNTGMRNKIVLVKTPQGRMIIADLGPSEKLGDLQLTADRSIQVQGRWLRVGNQPVILVEQVTMNGKTTPIQHPLGQITQQKSRSMKGEILREKDVSVKGTAINNKVIMLKTDKDQQVLVDLGSTENLKDVQIQKGKQIEVQGWPIRVGDQLVVLARQLTMNGKTIEIQRLQKLQQQRDAGAEEKSGLDATTQEGQEQEQSSEAGIEDKAKDAQEEAGQEAEQFQKDEGTQVEEEKSGLESQVEEQKDTGAGQESQQ